MASDSDNEKSRNSLSQVSYDSVFQMILSRELTGGSVIQERKLADALGVSRTPMREALIRLEGEGWLVRLTDRLLSVKVVTLDEYVHALGVRLLLETDAVKRASNRIDPDQLRKLRALFEDLKTDPDPSNVKHWIFDDALHNSIADASGNPVMARIIRDLRSITHLFENQTVPQRLNPGMAEHEAILDALESGDPKRSAKSMTAHLEVVRSGVLDNL